MIGIVSRLAGQKGFDAAARRDAGSPAPARLPVLSCSAAARRRFEEFFEQLQQRVPAPGLLLPRLLQPAGPPHRGRRRHVPDAVASTSRAASTRCTACATARCRSCTRPAASPTRCSSGTRRRGTGNGILFENHDEAGLRWAIEAALVALSRSRRLAALDAQRHGGGLLLGGAGEAVRASLRHAAESAVLTRSDRKPIPTATWGTRAQELTPVPAPPPDGSVTDMAPAGSSAARAGSRCSSTRSGTTPSSCSTPPAHS